MGAEKACGRWLRGWNETCGMSKMMLFCGKYVAFPEDSDPQTKYIQLFVLRENSQHIGTCSKYSFSFFQKPVRRTTSPVHRYFFNI